MAFSGRTPTVSEKHYMSLICELGCIACLLDMAVTTPASPHHRTGKTAPGAHYLTLGLCYPHHQGGVDCIEYTSRHPYKARFEERYGTEEELQQAILDRIGVQLDEQAKDFFISQGFTV